MITFHMRGATRSTGWLSISDTRRGCCIGRGAWFVFVSAQFSNPTPGTRLALYRPKRRVAYILQAVMVFPLKHFVTRKKYGRLNINHVIRMDRRMDLGRGSKWARRWTDFFPSCNVLKTNNFVILRVFANYLAAQASF